MGAKEDYNTIVISPEPRGRFVSCIIDGALLPGTIVQLKAATAKVNGLFTYEAYNRAADGNRPQGAIAVLVEDNLQGRTIDDAYTDQQIAQIYFPLPGDELLVMKQDQDAGVAIGDIFILDDGTGELLDTTGTPQSEPFMCMEAYADPGADQLTHVQFSGM